MIGPVQTDSSVNKLSPHHDTHAHTHAHPHPHTHTHTHTHCLLSFLNIIIYLSAFVLHMQLYHCPSSLLILRSFIHSDIPIMSLQLPLSPFTQPCTHPSMLLNLNHQLHPPLHPSHCSVLWYHWSEIGYKFRGVVFFWGGGGEKTKKICLRLQIQPLFLSVSFATARTLHPCMPSEPILSCWSTEVES